MLEDLEKRFVRTQLLLLGFFVWGVSFLYLIATVLFNPVQTRWVLMSFTWDAFIFGVPLIIFRPMLRRIQRYARELQAGNLDGEQAAVYQRKVLAYPFKVALEVFFVSIIAYTLGSLQVRYFAALPWEHVALIMICGGVCALLWATADYFVLEYDMRPLTELALAANRGVYAPVRRVSLRVKIFVCSLTLVVASLGFFGVVAYTRAVRMLETENGTRLSSRIEELANLIGALPPPAGGGLSEAWWMLAGEFSISPRGYMHVVDSTGTILATHPASAAGAKRLDEEEILPAVRARILTDASGYLADQVYDSKIVSFAAIPGTQMKLVAIAPLRDFNPQLDQLVDAGLAAIGFALLLSLGIGFLCTRSITASIVAVTRAAAAVAEKRDLSQRVQFMTNDEVGGLAHSFNQMAERLQTYAEGLEQLVAERTRELEDRKQQLEAKNTDLNDFLYVASHDLRAPLINLTGFSHALQESIAALGTMLDNGGGNHQGEGQPVEWAELKEDIDESLGFILRSTAKMDMLVSTLLDLSRIESRASMPRTIDTGQLVEEVLGALRFQIAEKKIAVTTGKLPSVVGDPVRINQVFSNLIDNAIKYMPAREEARIDIGCEEEGEQYRFFVRDTGMGIRPEDHDKIFRLFTRLGSNGIAGDGVGLAAVRKVVEKHGGRIWVESQLGKGSTFWFTLPRQRPENGRAHAGGHNRADL
jgi:signal transduction histidine kinase/FtsH-binding integral membrane protein